MTKQPDRLMFKLMLRQIEAPSPSARAAYERLENGLSVAPKTSPRTIILDWLEAELMSLHQAGKDEDNLATLLLRDAVELAKAAGGDPLAALAGGGSEVRARDWGTAQAAHATPAGNGSFRLVKLQPLRRRRSALS